MTPDIILTPYSGITQDEYNTLAQIAPTVAYPKTAWGTSWQDDQTITGQALGFSAESKQLVSDTEASIASQTDQFPQLKGKTFVYGNMGDGSLFNLYTTTDSRSLFLAAIGLVPSDYTKSLDAKADAASYFVPVSFELAGEIEGDIVVFWFGSQDELDTALALPGDSGGQAWQLCTDRRQGAGDGQFCLLSTLDPYMLDEFVPTLAAAAEKV